MFITSAWLIQPHQMFRKEYNAHTSVEQLLGKELNTARIAMILYVVYLLIPLMVTGKMNVSGKYSSST